MVRPAAQALEHWRSRSTPVEVEGANTRVWTAGDGAPVVCVHGVPASAYLYRRVLPALALRGMKAIAFDLPGLGLADRPGDFDYSWSGLSAWCERLVRNLGLERYHLVVHDIGGPIGFDLIRRAPERIASLTVLNTMLEVATFRPPWVMRPFRTPRLGEAYLGSINRYTLAALMRTHGTVRPMALADAANYVRLLKMGDGGRAFLRIMRSFELTEEFERRITGALVHRRFPAQILWGEHDPALPLDKYAPPLARALRVDNVIRLPGKHFIQEDAFDAIADAIAQQGANS